jgi:phosphatidylserine/phosphatidylglycerophosphate/cardiolipin synthase-like enzyme
MLPGLPIRRQSLRDTAAHGRRGPFAMFAALLLAGCASLPPTPADRPETHALSDPRTTALGRLIERSAPNGSFSGFRLLLSGEDAFGSLAALADSAERTLDLQYYLIRGDASSRALLTRVQSAAERGVRVRMLIDDLNTAGEDGLLLRLAEHRNIDVRLYNPLPGGRGSTVTRVLASLTDIARINRRMHNKMMVADNALAIMGGRNLGDAYFVQSEKGNFVDLDVIAAGPVVPAMSRSFDRFWNDPLAYPVHAIAAAAADPDANPAALAAPGELPAAAQRSIATNALARQIAARRLDLVWAPAAVIADTPSKISSEDDPTRQETLADDMDRLMRSATAEVIVVSPYYVPGTRGVALAEDLQGKGVALRVLTNSLATTDAPVVHIGYSRYREPLLRAGVELYELRPQLDAPPRSRLGSFGSSQASLHSKALIIDRRTLLVGSMNMDPRSDKLNSEIGLVIRSRELARQMQRFFEQVSRHSAWHVTPGGEDDGGGLRWSRAEPEPATLRTEPEASPLLRFTLKLLSPFAPEEML